VARLRTGTATSAGGIVVRFDEGVPSLVVGARRRDRDLLTWTLPKGTPNAGETREQTALREVAEETGLEVRITDVLDSIEYWFVQRGTRIHKTVHYYLMEPTGGDLSAHDHEFDQVRWAADGPCAWPAGGSTTSAARATRARSVSKVRRSPASSKRTQRTWSNSWSCRSRSPPTGSIRK